MRFAGAVLILSGGWLCAGLRRREGRRLLALCEALTGDLAVLAWRVCVCREPVPRIIETALWESGAADRLWRPLHGALAAGERSLPECWRGAAAQLGEPLDRMLEPLGPLLPVGGDRLDRAVEETREELTGFLRAERARQAQDGRIAAALCLSGASLLVLVLM